MTSSPTDLLNFEIPSTLDWMGRLRLWGGALACFLVFWWWTGVIGLPAVPHMGGSLFSQPQPSVAIGAIAAALILCTVLGRLIVGYLRIGADLQFDGGVMAALVGMMAVVFRLGPVRYALFSMDDPQVFVLLGAELLLMYVVVGLCWLGLQFAAPTVPPAPSEPLSSKLGAIATSVAVMTACMIFISRSDATSQSLAAVGISALAGAMAGHIAFPVKCSVWYWIAPGIVGVAGYAIAFADPSGLATGFTQGALGALSHPSPMAYASAGPAGAIFGYWMASRWHHEQAVQAAAQAS